MLKDIRYKLEEIMMFQVSDPTGNYDTVQIPSKELIFWAQDFAPEDEINTVGEATKTLADMGFEVSKIS